MNCLVFLPVVTALIFVRSAAEHETHGRIFNGQNAERDQFKYMVAVVTHLSKPPSKKAMCGGTIIGPNWVLTAAHCVDGREKVAIYLGALDRHDAEISYEVQKRDVILHPKWNNKFVRNDIALIRIPTTSECEKIAFARMPISWMDRPLSTFTDMAVVAVGWGKVGDSGHLSSWLKWAEMKIINQEECNKFYGDITGKHLCVTTIEPYGSTCLGDSGGPLVLQATGELIGVISTIPRTGCEKGDPTVFVRLTRYLPWIIKVTGLRFHE